jgi:hypothetical protein
MNAFNIARPRGKDMPSATPRGSNRSKAPMQGQTPSPKAMDRNGRFTVRMVSPPHFGYVGAIPPTGADSSEVDLQVQRALQDSRIICAKRAGQSVFDKSTGGTK